VPTAKLALFTTLAGGTTGAEAASTRRADAQKIESRRRVVCKMILNESCCL
jgi:hypothetical protein